MHRTELGNMIKIVRLLIAPKSFARAYPLPRSAASHYIVTEGPSTLLLYPKASSYLAHTIENKHESTTKRSEHFEREG